MKKIFVVLIIIALGFSAISCEKTCICKGKETRMPIGSIHEPEIRDIHIEVGKKSKSACDAFIYESKEEDGYNITHNVTCTLE